jgi:TPR repeat protein
MLALALVVAAPAAQAQFYDLDGAYHCVTAPDQACGAGETAHPAPTQQQQADKKPPPPPPSLAEAIDRVKRRAATEADIALLDERAEAKDPRAIEVLAWCKLNGIGMKPDALAAFWLYHDAAALGVANAGKNEIAIYEDRLSSAERQEVLVKENAR